MKFPSTIALNPADFTRTIRRMIVPAGTAMEDVSIPGNWSNLFSKVAVRDEIIVETEDMAWRLHLYVTEIGIGWVKTVPLHMIEFVKKAKPVEAVNTPDVPDGYKVQWAGPHSLYRVLAEGGLEVSKKHKTEHEAVLAAVAHAANASGLIAA
jgi:hypothetical protein